MNFMANLVENDWNKIKFHFYHVTNSFNKEGQILRHKFNKKYVTKDLKKLL